MILQRQSGLTAPDVEGEALADKMMSRTAAEGGGGKLTLDDFQDLQVTLRVFGVFNK